MELILDGVRDGRRMRFPLDPGRCRVGRASRNDLVLSDMSVSREHAEIGVGEDGIEVRDLGSRNGTWVGGRRVLDVVEVRVGQTIRFGSRNAEFALVEASSLDWKRLLRPVGLSPNESIEAQGAVGATPGPLPHPGAEPSIDTEVVAAMAEAGHLLVLPNTPIDAIAEICEQTRRILPWRRAAVLVREPAGERPALLVAQGWSEATEERLLLSLEAWEALARDRLPLLLKRARPEGRGIGSDDPPSALAIPILERGKVGGALYLECARTALTQTRLAALGLVSDLLAVRLSQARASRALRDRERLEREVSLAARIQARLLSNASLDQGEYEALARQIPCYEVAGDLYDVSVRPDGRVILLLGDAAGKGMGASLLMSNVMAAFRALSPEIPDPAELITHLHEQLLRYTEPWQFVTLFLGLVDVSAHALEYANAGHCAPLLVPPEAPHGNLASTGPPLGLLPGSTYHSERASLPPGALLCVYSDGVTEASSGGQFYGEARLVETLRGSRSLPPPDLVDRIVREVRRFTQEQPLADDMTVMILRRRE